MILCACLHDSMPPFASFDTRCCHVQVVFAEASAAAGHTVDRGVTVMDAAGLTLSALTGFAQRVR